MSSKEHRIPVARQQSQQVGYARVIDDYEDDDGDDPRSCAATAANRRPSERRLHRGGGGGGALSAKEAASKHRRQQLKRAFVKCAKYAFSTVGTALLSAAYVAAGAVAFSAIELPAEIESCASSEADYFSSENTTAALVLDVVRRYNGTAFALETEQETVEAELLSVLRDFSVQVLDVGYNYSKECRTIGEPDGRQPNWSFLGSLFFAITVVTTIGYGNFAPVTDVGRGVCMVYALFGIPIMLACLANLTGLMANVFRFVYASFCCCGCLVKDDEPEDYALAPQVPSGSSKAVWVTDATGRPIQPVVNAAKATAAALPRQDCERAVSPSSQSDAGSVASASSTDEDGDDEEDDDPVNVPLTVSIILLFSYVLIAGSVFSALDERMLFTTALYFAFVTTATIGFGDVLPEYQGDITKILLNSLLMVIGIAMLGLCFQLMQDEFVTKIRWISSKISEWKKRKQQQQKQQSVQKVKIINASAEKWTKA